MLCRQLNLFWQAVVAVDDSKFKAVNNRDRNFTSAEVQQRMEQIGLPEVPAQSQMHNW